MEKLAIKGHETRGNEVIEILAMLGGVNYWGFTGNDTTLDYYIESNRITICYEDKDILKFTLEEFLEKFPYKIGDKVQDLKSDKVFTIANMFWDEKDCSVYYFNSDIMQYYNVEDLKLYKEINEISNNITLTHSDKEGEKKSLLSSLIEYFKTTPKDVLEREWNEHKELDEIGPTVEEYIDFVESFKKNSKYPKTYCECCDILCYNSSYDLNNIATHDCVYDHKLQMFYRVLICRDAYWKIAGEQMGLDKPWKPDWTNTNTNKYCIYCVGGEIKKQPMLEVHHLLAFPTSEMRDAFYENFKDLIESCKELI